MTFNDGRTESFDLLIGGDGVSTTRALVFGPEEQFSRYLGYTIGSTWKMYVEPGRLAATYCTQKEGELLIFFIYQSPKPEQPLREQRLWSKLTRRSRYSGASSLQEEQS